MPSRDARGALATVVWLSMLTSCGSKTGLFVGSGLDANTGVEPPDGSDSGHMDAALDVTTDAALDVTTDTPAPLCVGGVPSAPWAWTAGGSESELAAAIALDPNGAVYTVGTFAGAVDFDPGPALDEHTAVDRLDVFLTKLGCDGIPLWTRRWGGPDQPGSTSGWGDEGEAVAVAPDGSVLVGGQYCSIVDFDPGPAEDLHTSQSCFDGFVVSLDASGSYRWVATFGGSGRDRVGGLAVASDGSIYAAGQFEGVVDFDPGPGETLRASAGEIDEFVVKLTAQGQLEWVMTWGGPATEYGTGHVALTSAGAVVVAGQFSGQADFDPGPGLDVRTSAGSDDAFVIAFSSGGERLWARTFGGASYEGVGAVATGPDDSVYVGGSFYGPADFDPGAGVDVRSNAGLYDAYLVRLDEAGSYEWTRTWGAIPNATAPQNMVGVAALAATPEGRVLVGGNFQGQIDLDSSEGMDVRSSTTLDRYDGYVSVFGAGGEVHGGWTFGSAGHDAVLALAAHAARALAAGDFGGPIELAPYPMAGGLEAQPVGKQDAFVVHW